MARNKANDVLKLVLTALFAAFVCVATMLVPIYIPATGGYANLGDGVILLGAFMLHPMYAVIAAGIGSMLADILASYVQYAPATLVIKAAVALVAALIYNRLGRGKQTKVSFLWMVAAGAAAEAVMVLGYFFYEAVVLRYGLAAAASIPANLGQGAVGVLVACVTVPALQKNGEVKNMMDKTWK